MFREVLGIVLVDQVPRQLRQGLTLGDHIEESGDPRVSPGDMVGDTPDRPLLCRRHLLPVGFAQPFDDLGELAARLVELLGQLLGSRSHVPLLVT